MGNLPYVAFYPGKWLGRTARLSALERGVFITLICEMYETMAPLKLEHKALARLCGTTPKTLEKALAVLLDDPNKLVMSEGGLWSHRVEKEIKKAQKTSEISRQNSQKRWEKHKKNNDGAMPSHSSGNAIQNHNKKDIPNGITPTDQAFADFVEAVEGTPIPKPRSLTADRRRKIEARLREHGPDVWREACQRLAASPFCQGENDRGWRADLDFLLQPKSFNRLIEGGYDQAAPRGQSPPQPSRHVQRLQTANDWINDGNESEAGDSGDAERLGAAQGRRHGTSEHLRLIAGDQKH
jgi:uncharacterized protein YdaU (DUF1376 family)